MFLFVWFSLLVRSTIQQIHSKVVSRFGLDYFKMRSNICKLSAGTTLSPSLYFYATFAGSTLLLRNNHTGYSKTEVIYSVDRSFGFSHLVANGLKAAAVTLRGVLIP